MQGAIKKLHTQITHHIRVFEYLFTFQETVPKSPVT